jgi:hypothetical protein
MRGTGGLDALKVLGRSINSRLIALRWEGRARGERERDGQQWGRPMRGAGRGVQTR